MCPCKLCIPYNNGNSLFQVSKGNVKWKQEFRNQSFQPAT